jgi:hypothetical protein
VGIVAGAYLCLQGGLESRKLIESRMDLAQKARVALGLLAADLAQACPLYKGPLGDGSEFVGMRREIGDMEADNLDFATRNWRPRGPGEADSCEVSWFVDRNPRTGAMGLWRRRDPTPDDEPLAGGSREEIAEGIAGLRLEYFDGYSWYESWGDDSQAAAGRTSEALSSYNLGGLPDAVRITLAFPDGVLPPRSPRGDGVLPPRSPQGDGVLPPRSPRGDVDIDETAKAFGRAVADVVDRRLEEVLAPVAALYQRLQEEARAFAGAAPPTGEELKAVIEDSVADLRKILKSLGGDFIVPQAGEPYDPLIHLAVGETSVPGAEEGMIAGVVRPGYRSGRGRVVLPARVLVARR